MNKPWVSNYRIGLKYRCNGIVATIKTPQGEKKYRYCVSCGGLTLSHRCSKCDRVTVCSWCGKVKDIDDNFKNLPYNIENANHVICSDCEKEMYRENYSFFCVNGFKGVGNANS